MEKTIINSFEEKKCRSSGYSLTSFDQELQTQT